MAMTRRRAAKGPRTHVGLEQRFLASLRQLELRPGQTIVVGFSGGKDSLALAQLFARTKPISSVEPRLLHVNHNLRPTSGQEAEQAKLLAKQLALPITVTEIEPGLVDRNPGLGVEEAARRERYLALKDFARKRRTDVIATAHQRQDQAESVVLHLLRGAGISGMVAMAELLSMPIPWWEGPTRSKPFRLWRPLLDEDPETLSDYLWTHELVPIEDPSNEEPKFVRNRIRNEVIPLLEELQPEATEAIARFAKIASLEDAFLSETTFNATQALVKDFARLVRVGAMRAHPVFLRRVLKQMIEVAGSAEVRFDRIEQVRAMTYEEPSDKVIELGSGVIAVSDDEWVYIGTEDVVTAQIEAVHDIWLYPPSVPPGLVIPIRPDEPISVEALTIHASADPANFGKPRPWRRFLPAVAFNGDFVLRKADEGDVWARQGSTIREQLRVTGIPPFARSRIMVFASAEGVWYIPGVSRPVGEMARLDEPIIYLDIRKQDKEIFLD